MIFFFASDRGCFTHVSSCVIFYFSLFFVRFSISLPNDGRGEAGTQWIDHQRHILCLIVIVVIFFSENADGMLIEASFGFLALLVALAGQTRHDKIAIFTLFYGTRAWFRSQRWSCLCWSELIIINWRNWKQSRTFANSFQVERNAPSLRIQLRHMQSRKLPELLPPIKLFFTDCNKFYYFLLTASILCSFHAIKLRKAIPTQPSFGTLLKFYDANFMGTILRCYLSSSRTWVPTVVVLYICNRHHWVVVKCKLWRNQHPLLRHLS